MPLQTQMLETTLHERHTEKLRKVPIITVVFLLRRDQTFVLCRGTSLDQVDALLFPFLSYWDLLAFRVDGPLHQTRALVSVEAGRLL